MVFLGLKLLKKCLPTMAYTDVKVVSVKGMLTDHYNPMKETVNLSEACTVNVTLQLLLLLRMNVVMQYNTPRGMNGSKYDPFCIASGQPSRLNLSMWVIIAGLGMFGGTQSYTIAVSACHVWSGNTL